MYSAKMGGVPNLEEEDEFCKSAKRLSLEPNFAFQRK